MAGKPSGALYGFYSLEGIAKAADGTLFLPLSFCRYTAAAEAIFCRLDRLQHHDLTVRWGRAARSLEETAKITAGTGFALLCSSAALILPHTDFGVRTMAILRRILQKFSAKPLIAESAALLTAVDTQRYASLWQLQTNRQLLEVLVTGREGSYQSMIIALDFERKLLWLDDLFPAQRELEIGDEVTVRHHRNGEMLVFTTPVIASGAAFGASGIAVILPDVAEYQPRRTAPRSNLSEHAPVSAKVRLLGQEAFYGTVKDVSEDGLCVMVPGNLLSQLHHGAIMPLCEVYLTREIHIHCRARVCSFSLCREPYRGTRINLEFIDLQPKRRVQLQGFIRQLTAQMDTAPLVRAA